MKLVEKVTIVAALLLGMVVALGSTAMAALEVEGGAYAGVYDKYLWRGFDLSGGKPVAQGGVDLTAGNFTLSYWVNSQLSTDKGNMYDEDGNLDDSDDLNAGEINETDITLDYSVDVNELVSLSVGNVMYALDGADDTNEAYLKVGLKTLLNPTVAVYWDWDESEEAGLFYVVSIGHDFEVNDALTVSVSANAGYNQENYSVDETYSDWHNAEFGVKVDYQLTEQFSVTPSFVYSTPLSDDAREIAEINDETAAGLTVNFTF